MLALSDRPVAPVRDFFSKLGIEVGFLVPTETGLRKSILDATDQFRAFLKFQKFHDYSTQGQGPDHKRLVEASFVGVAGLSPTTASLYRPKTKNGDPRIWFYSLSDYAKAGNLLACFQAGDRLFVLNTSDPSLWDKAGDPSSFAGRTIRSSISRFETVEQELLQMLRSVASGGWHRTVRAGPTGVGATLEDLLGISANSSKDPDYKGIEIKSARRKMKPTGKLQTLFSKTPDWKASDIGTASLLLARHGYLCDGRKQIYCTVNASGTANGLGYYLDINDAKGMVWCRRRQENNVDECLLAWEIDILREAMRNKHGSTVWVSAESRGKGTDEEFRYFRAEFTIAPPVSQFSEWLKDDVISLDLTLSDKGGGKVRDHGYLFRCKWSAMSKIFAHSDIYEL